MCRNVKIKLTYFKVRLSLRLVRSLRTIWGCFRQFPAEVVPPLKTKWKAGQFAPFSQFISADQLHKKLSRHDGEQRNIIKIIFPWSQVNFPSYKTSKVITQPFFVVENLNNIRPYGNPPGVNHVRRPRLFETLEDHVPLCALFGQSKFMPHTNTWLLTRGNWNILSRVKLDTCLPHVKIQGGGEYLHNLFSSKSFHQQIKLFYFSNFLEIILSLKHSWKRNRFSTPIVIVCMHETRNEIMNVLSFDVTDGRPDIDGWRTFEKV